MSESLVSTLQSILLGKVAYDTDIPEHRLLADTKFREYWDDYCQTDDDTWRLDSVIEYALELAYSGDHFGDDLWED